MTKEMEQLKKGQFYFIYDGDYEYFIVEDRTKRGLPVIEKSVDDNVGVTVEKDVFTMLMGEDMLC
jgi:hypothetical protein